MARIKTFNKIAAPGIELLEGRGHHVSGDGDNPDAILLRSATLHEREFGPGIKAIGRAGAGVNNIPVDRCTERGIVVFNTPGSNANSVKELVIAGLMLSSRKIIDGYNWCQTLTEGDAGVAARVEAGKNRFAGPEVFGKTLGIVGLGAIGVMVANAAEALGMDVLGFDPYLSVERAWGLSRTVKRARTLESLLADSDYVSLHTPLNDSTRDTICAKTLAAARPGVRILNFARGGLVNTKDVVAALESGRVEAYVTDFPEAALLRNERVITVPHLGASTPEAETNSAVMAARQLADYLEFGHITNSVNFPDCALPMSADTRMTIANRNVPNMVGQISAILADHQINIAEMVNMNRGDLAYNIIDMDGDVDDAVFERIRAIDGVLFVRSLDGSR